MPIWTIAKDSFGHAQLGGLAAFLANQLKKETGAKVRGIELSLLQRCAAHCASKTDIEESFAAGKAAVENAVAGVTDKMVGFERTMENGKYNCNIKLFDLTDVANTEKKVPLEWINETRRRTERRSSLNMRCLSFRARPTSASRGRTAPFCQAQEGQGVSRFQTAVFLRRSVWPAVCGRVDKHFFCSETPGVLHPLPALPVSGSAGAFCAVWLIFPLLKRSRCDIMKTS